MVNWKEYGVPFENFTEEVTQQWINKSFTKDTCKEWLDIGVKVEDSDYCAWLRNVTKSTPEEILNHGDCEWFREQYGEYLENRNNIKQQEIEIKEGENNCQLVDLKSQGSEVWDDIHPDFSKKELWIVKSNYFHPKEDNNKTYQQEWKESGFTYEETKEWIKAGLSPEEYGFASYLKERGLYSSNVFQKKSKAQIWIDWKYPLEKRKEIRKLDISNENLEGYLKLNDFINLESLNCSVNKLIFLIISDCEELSKLDCFGNHLTNITLLLPKQGKKLVSLSIGYNLLSDLSIFSHLENLEVLNVDNNLLTGSLEPLKKLSKLKKINIDGNYLDFGLEYLPKLEKIRIAKKIENKLVKSPITLLIEQSDEYDLCSWRQEQPGYQWLAQFLSEVNSSLDVQEVISKFDFFNVKTGTFEGNLQEIFFLFQINKNLFEQKEKQINSLELHIKELNNLIKKQKRKIINAYLSFAPEKELLKELIKIHLEYSKSREQKQPIVKIRKQKEKIFDKLMEKVGEDVMEETEMILKDCEELIVWEIELEEKINEKSLLLKEKKQIPQSIADSQTKIILLEDNTDSQISYYNNLWEELLGVNSSVPKLTYEPEKPANSSKSTGLTKPLKRKLTLSAEDKDSTKEIKLDNLETMEIDQIPNQNWQNIHSNFTSKLIQSWQNHNFTYSQTRDWINIHSPTNQEQAIQEPEFYAYLRDELNLTPEQVLNDHTISLSELKKHFQEYQQFQAQIQIPPK